MYHCPFLIGVMLLGINTMYSTLEWRISGFQQLRVAQSEGAYVPRAPHRSQG